MENRQWEPNISQDQKRFKIVGINKEEKMVIETKYKNQKKRNYYKYKVVYNEPNAKVDKVDAKFIHDKGEVSKNGRIVFGVKESGIYSVYIYCDGLLGPKDPFWRQDVFINKLNQSQFADLAQKYAPILVYSDKEEYYPLPLEYFVPYGSYEPKIEVNKPFIFKRKTTKDDPEYNAHPRRESRSDCEITEKVAYKYLGDYMAYNGSKDILINSPAIWDTHLNPLKELTIERLNRESSGKMHATIYYSVLKRNDKYYLNYHFLYPYDFKTGNVKKPGVGAHIFDRESLTLVFASNEIKIGNEGVSVNNDANPDVVFGAHLQEQIIEMLDENLKNVIDWTEGRARISWDNIIKYSNRPVIAIAQGSHALYPVPGLYRCDPEVIYDSLEEVDKKINLEEMTEPAGDSISEKSLFKVKADDEDNKWKRILFPGNLDVDEELPKEKQYKLKSLNLDKLTSNSNNAPLVFSGAWVDVLHNPFEPLTDNNAHFPPFTDREKDPAEWTSGAYTEWNWEEVPKYSKELTRLLKTYLNLQLNQVDITVEPETDFEKETTAYLSGGLAKAVREKLGKEESEPVYPGEAAEIEALEAGNKGITDLNGIQYLTNLKKLDLGNKLYKKGKRNKIKDLSPLVNLPNLEELRLVDNEIEDLKELFTLEKPGSEMEGLLKLLPNLADKERVDFATKADQYQLLTNKAESKTKEDKPKVKIGDIDILSNLTNLQKLDLSGNKIDNIEFLSKLVNHKNLNWIILMDSNNLVNFSGSRTRKIIDKLENQEKNVLIDTGMVHVAAGRNQVAVDYDFYIGKYAVTQKEYKQVMKTNQSEFKEGTKDRPVENVSWYEAVEYCNKLSDLIGLPRAYDEEYNLIDKTGNSTDDLSKVSGYRLPTTTEWTYAARGGKDSKNTEYPGSNSLDEIAWHMDSKPRPVGQKKPNELGIYDLLGNVWEWCYDLSPDDHDNYLDRNTGRMGRIPTRILKGGSWPRGAEKMGLNYSAYFMPDFKHYSIGFRIVRSAFLTGLRQM